MWAPVWAHTCIDNRQGSSPTLCWKLLISHLVERERPFIFPLTWTPSTIEFMSSKAYQKLLTYIMLLA